MVFRREKLQEVRLGEAWAGRGMADPYLVVYVQTDRATYIETPHGWVVRNVGDVLSPWRRRWLNTIAEVFRMGLQSRDPHYVYADEAIERKKKL